MHEGDCLIQIRCDGSRLAKDDREVALPSVPDANGLKDRCQIDNLQEQALIMLKSHVETSFPYSQSRYGALLLLVTGIRLPIPHLIEKTYFEKTIGTAKMEKLLCDMFQS